MGLRAQSVLVWWGLTFAVIFFLAWYFLTGMLPPPPAGETAEQIKAFYDANASGIRTGATICGWVSAFLLPVFVVVSVQMWRVEKGRPVWSILQFGGGMMWTIFFTLPPVCWGIAAFDLTASAEITALMHRAGFLLLLSTDQYYVFQMVPLAVIALTTADSDDNPFKRWFGYLTIFTILLIELAPPSLMMRSGPFAWHGLFPFWLPLGVFSVWFPVLIVLLLRAIHHQAEQPAPSTT